MEMNALTEASDALIAAGNFLKQINPKETRIEALVAQARQAGERLVKAGSDLKRAATGAKQPSSTS